MSAKRDVLKGGAIGVIVALFFMLLLFPQPVESAPGKSWVYRGMAPEPQTCYLWYQFGGVNPCWHDDESGTYTAVDYNGSGWEDAGALVQLWYYSSQQYVKFLALSGTTCTGMRAVFYENSDRTIYGGEVRFLHIDNYSGVISTTTVYRYWDGNDYVNYRDIGVVSSSQESDCSWDGPHLHQSADTGASTAFWTNWSSNPTSSWEHEICWSGACP